MCSKIVSFNRKLDTIGKFCHEGTLKPTDSSDQIQGIFSLFRGLWTIIKELLELAMASPDIWSYRELMRRNISDFKQLLVPNVRQFSARFIRLNIFQPDSLVLRPSGPWNQLISKSPCGTVRFSAHLNICQHSVQKSSRFGRTRYRRVIYWVQKLWKDQGNNYGIFVFKTIWSPV